MNMGNQASGNAAVARIEQLLGHGMLEAAESACREVVESTPRESRAWALLGRVFAMQRRWTDAEPTLRQAVSLDKRDASSWTNLAVALRGQGRAAEAEKCSRKAVLYDGSSFANWAVLGGCLLDQGRRDPSRLPGASEAL